MKARYLCLSLLLAMVLAGPAAAKPVLDLRPMWKKLTTSIPAPPEWQGVWSEVDSQYTCSPFALNDVSSELDTVCAGQEVVPPGSSSSPFTIDCTGTADANSVHMHCTGGGVVAPSCSVQIDMQIDATRTSDSFYSVNRLNITYVGAGCGGIPSECYEDHVHGTRTGPATAYCATPTEPSTWGKLKAHYR
jgi:hypothetical protein